VHHTAIKNVHGDTLQSVDGSSGQCELVELQRELFCCPQCCCIRNVGRTHEGAGEVARRVVVSVDRTKALN
jgi:hypothetical protein